MKIKLNVILYGLGSLIWLCSCLGSSLTAIVHLSHEQVALANTYIGLTFANIACFVFFALLTIWHLRNDKLKLYVYQSGKYQRVTGPKELLTSVGGFGGHVVIGDRFEIKTVFFAGKNRLSNRSINGFSINKMDLAPIDESDERELGIFLEEE